MNPMEKLCHATIEQLKEYLGQHGIRTDIQHEDRYDIIKGAQLMTWPRKNRVFSVIAYSAKWPMVEVASRWDLYLPPHGHEDTRIEYVDITDGFDEILELYREEM